MSKLDYKEDMYIDESNLDNECIEHGDLAIKYGTHYAKAFEKFTKAEENIKYTRSLLTKQAHKNPEKHLGPGNPTDKKVEAFYRTHKDYLKAKKEWIKAHFDLNMAEHAKKEICYTRKAMLQNLIELYKGQYFAGPVNPRDFKKERVNFRKRKKIQKDK